MDKNFGKSNLPDISEIGSNWERSQEMPKPEIDGYTIIECIGEGGMGVVWKAKELSTKRTVALKILRSFHSTKDKHGMVSDRFEREVEILAQLEHDNIARVYSSGIHRGAFYYAMEYIDGDDLTTYVPNRNMTHREILTLFKEICQAVQHAHQRGVIHRDLKPANILVDKNGKPHIVDFGLAKLFNEKDQAQTMTVEGQIAGTYPYMSPEQALGRTSQLDTRSDVYSLGTIAYQLLAKQFPYHKWQSLKELLHSIADGEIIRPRELTKDIDGELEAILVKSLSHEPDDRYSSAGELAKDIDNYLSNEPLIARKPTTVYFLRKRIRKYRVPFAAGVLVLTAMLAMAFYYYVQISHERDRAEMALASEKDARQEADKNANLAYDHYLLAVDILSTMVFETYEKIENSPGLYSYKKELLGNVSDNLEKIKTSVLDSDLRASHSLIAVYTKIGAVYEKTGKTEQARQMYMKSQDVIKELLQENPEDVKTLHEKATLHIRLGDLATTTDHITAAEKEYLSAYDICNTLLEDKYEGIYAAYFVNTISCVLSSMGDIRKNQHRYDESIDYYEKALKITRDLTEKNKNDSELRRSLVLTYKKLADLSLKLGDTSKALEYCNNCFDIYSNMDISETDSQLNHDLSYFCNILGDMFYDSEKYGAAMGCFEWALEIREGMVQADNENVALKRDVAVSYSKVGKIYSDMGKFKESNEKIQNALKHNKSLLASDPENSKYKFDMIVLQQQISDNFMEMKEYEQAWNYTRQSHELLIKLLNKYPDNANYIIKLAVAFRQYACVYIDNRELEKGLDSYVKAHEILGTLRERKMLGSKEIVFMEILEERIVQVKSSLRR